MLRRFHPLFVSIHTNHPRELTTEVCDALGRLADAVLEWGGTLDKFLGDGLMAMWGAPVRRADDADQAAAGVDHRHRQVVADHGVVGGEQQLGQVAGGERVDEVAAAPRVAVGAHFELQHLRLLQRTGALVGGRQPIGDLCLALLDCGEQRDESQTHGAHHGVPFARRSS